MSGVVSFYRLDTGELTGERYAGTEIELNCPPGHAWLVGDISPHGQRVELLPDDFGNAVVPLVVPYQPPPPASTEWRTWEWDTEAKQYRPVATAAAQLREAARPLLAQLAELDAKLVRPAGEVTQALALGQALPPSAVTKLQEINAEKEVLRQQLAALTP